MNESFGFSLNLSFCQQPNIKQAASITSDTTSISVLSIQKYRGEQLDEVIERSLTPLLFCVS